MLIRLGRTLFELSDKKPPFCIADNDFIVVKERKRRPGTLMSFRVMRLGVSVEKSDFCKFDLCFALMISLDLENT